jgi:uncharacterized membrane protein
MASAPVQHDRPPAWRRLLRSRGTLGLLVVVLAAVVLLPHLSWYNTSRSARVERGTVRAVESMDGQDRLTIACPSGPVELTVERPTGLYAPQAVEPGDGLLVRFGAEGASLGPKLRERALLALVVIFFLVLALGGGPQALRTALSLLAAFVLLVVVLIPLALRGWDPLWTVLPLAGLIAGGTIFVVVGWGRKSLAAVLGTLGGLVLAVAVSAFLSWQLSLTGLSVDFGQYRELGRIYWQGEALWEVDFAGLLAAGVVLSCLGAAMDVAISVATAVQEVVRHRPDLSVRAVFRSGCQVGRAAVWMTAATLFFVLLGAGMEPFLARTFQHGGAGWVRLLSFEELAVAVVRLATAGLTMTLVAPLTALFAGLLLARSAKSNSASSTEPSEAPLPEAQVAPVRRPGFGGRRVAVALFAVVLALTLVLLDRLALRSIPEAAAPPDVAGFVSEQALGRVAHQRPPHVEHGSGRPASRQLPYRWRLVAAQLLTGSFAGRTVLVNKVVHPNPGWNIIVREGETVPLELAARGPITNVNFRKPALRYRELLWLMGALFGALLLFGGWRSARNTLGVFGLVALVVFGLLPKLASGWPPLLTMAGFSAVVVGGVLLLFYGWDRKAMAAALGTLGGLAVVVAVTAAASHGLKLYGLESAAGRWLVELRQHGGQVLDYRGLLLAGLLVAVLGVAMDTSVSIAAGIEELYRAHPAIERKQAFASGLAIGRDVMGVCATTFVFASIGVRLPMLFLPAAAGLSPAELVNTEAGCIEVVRILACGIGLLATAPLTALAAVAILSRQKGATSRTISPRAAARWGRIALVAEVAAIAGLVAGIVSSRPYEPQAPPRFESLDRGSFEAVVAEANDLLEEYDYPRAILLLWRAQERDIAPARIAVRLAHLYFDYQNYVHYYERSGLPSGMRPVRATEGHGPGGSNWAVHAEAMLAFAVAQDPDYAQAHFELGRLLASQDRAEEAIPHLERALEAQPDNVELLCDLAAAYTMEEQFEQAEPLARRAEQLAPDHPRVQELLDGLRAPEAGER